MSVRQDVAGGYEVSDMRDDLNCFFIAGAPRAGTTAMARYLKRHPAVAFSDPKETYFFMLAADGETPEAVRRRFIEAFFPIVTAETTLLGEGSVSTLYSAEAIGRMRRAFPAAKFIVMLRDPADLLRSYHARLVFLRLETEKDFAAAWRLQEARARGENVPRQCRDPRILMYREVGRLGHYTSEMIRLVGRENCLPVLFEDLVADTVGTYRKALAFLGLPDDGRTKFKKINEQMSYRSGFLQSLYAGPLMRPVATLMGRNPVLLARLQRATKPLRKRFKKMNAVEARPAPLEAAFRAELRAEFDADIRLLETIVGRDLSHWIAPQATAAPLKAVVGG
ncbi:MAG: sulfotransferase [Reyranellaceae bacterium]